MIDQARPRTAEARRRARSRSRPHRWLMAGALFCIAALGACGIGQQPEPGDPTTTASTQPTVSVTDTVPPDQTTATQPEQTTAPPTGPTTAPTPQPTTAPTTAAPTAPTTTIIATTVVPTSAPPVTVAPDSDGVFTLGWLLVVLLLMIAFALVVAATMAATRRADAKQAARRELLNHLSEIVGTSRWVHDSGSNEVLLATDVNQMQMAWYEVRARIITLESDIAALTANTFDVGLTSDLNYLAQSLADLRSAEEGYVTTKARAGNSRAELTRISDETVGARRRQLQAAIEPIAAAMRR